MTRAGATLLVAALLPGATLAAQGGMVWGQVTDSAGAPVSGAAVTVVGTALRTETENGHYRLAGVPPGRVMLRVTRIGYLPATDTVDVEAGTTVRQDFTLAASAVGLEPIEVSTPGRRAQPVEEAITGVAVIEEADIARRAVNTVDEALDRAPAVQMIGGQVNARGSSGFVQGLGNRVLVIVDDVPANQGDRGGINWDLVPVDQIERVEVVKGGGSAVYGSSALGGVIHLTTRDIPQGWHGRVRATGGVFADPPHPAWRFRDETGMQGGADVTASYGTRALRGRVAVGARHSDGYREQDARDHWQVAGKGEWRPADGTRLTVSGAWASDQYDVPLVWCTADQCEDRGQNYQPFKVDTSELGARTVSDKGYLMATVRRTPSARLRWQARTSWIRTHFTDYRDGVDFSVANRVGLEVRAEVHPSEQRVVTVGLEGTRSDSWGNIFSGDSTRRPRSRSHSEYAAYAESEQPLGTGRLTTGTRIDFLALDGGSVSAVLSPRVGFVVPSRAGVWRFAIARGFRAPSLAERFVSTSVFSLRVIPNPNLDPETGWAFELGNIAAVGSGLRLDAAVFWTEMEALIEPTVDLTRGTIQLRNVPRARLAGLDVALAAAPLPYLATSFSYMYLHARALARDTVPDKPLAFRPRHLATLTADYRVGPLTAGGDFRYMSRLENVELFQDVDVFPTDRRLSMQVLDLRASYRRGPLQVNLLAANVLNYIYNLVPRTLAPVRTVSVTLTWTY